MAGISLLASWAGSAVGSEGTRAGHIPLDAPSATKDHEIDKAAKDFESILLSSWLQQAEETFGALPGAEGEDDSDCGKEEYQGIAVQSLGASMTAAGGIGIARMIAQALHRADNARIAQAGSK